MTDEQIWETICLAMIEEFELEPHKMRPEARMKEDLNLDSLDMVDMVIVLETAFNFKIKDKAALAEISVLADVVAFISSTITEEKTRTADNDSKPS